ncbi:hypothetical protein EAF64_14645 [Halorientalis pallida]|uniref:TATA binding protein of transcription factor TFIID n=1 Tax=Halorientalis pallida TaxID=2479928 RepID=A0A498KSX4_9EURY|nr:hypothetical protein EAF64_14645 [Halorientalis pallida]
MVLLLSGSGKVLITGGKETDEAYRALGVVCGVLESYGFSTDEQRPVSVGFERERRYDEREAARDECRL